MELVGGGAEGLAGEDGQRLSGGLVKARRGVQPCPHGSAAQRQLMERRQCPLQKLPILLQAASPAGNLLGEGNGGGVLQMGAAALDDSPVFRLQPHELRNEPLQGRNHLILNGQHRRNVHGGGEGIVGGLGHIHVIVGVQQIFSQMDVSHVGDDLIGVHIGLGAGAGLPDNQWELVVAVPGDDLLAGLRNGGKLLVRHFLRANGGVGHGRRLFQIPEGSDDLLGHGFQAYADGEVLHAALGLSPPEFIRGDPNLAHGIVFNAVFHC